MQFRNANHRRVVTIVALLWPATAPDIPLLPKSPPPGGDADGVMCRFMLRSRSRRRAARARARNRNDQEQSLALLVEMARPRR